MSIYQCAFSFSILTKIQFQLHYSGHAIKCAFHKKSAIIITIIINQIIPNLTFNLIIIIFFIDPIKPAINAEDD